jgi:hypothetical protein
MTNLSRWSWGMAAIVLAVGACGGNGLGNNGGTGGFGTGGFPSYTGGAPGWTGGYPGTGGVPGTGGIPQEGGYGGFPEGTGGVPATGGWTGTGGVPGTGGSPLFPDGGTCSSPSRGPLSTAESPRPFGWTFTAGSLGTGNADAGVGPARCQEVPAAYPGVSCVGTAEIKSLVGGPLIAFADGSQLTWDGTLPAALAPGARTDVSVDYERKTTVVCAVCGAYTTNTLLIRDTSGQIVFYDQQGDVLPSLSDTMVKDIFGVAATTLQTCTYPVSTGCYEYLRSEFDHQLATSPAQTITDAALTTVTAPNGKFAVIWASSNESYVLREENCLNGPGVATDTGFVATLTSP